MSILENVKTNSRRLADIDGSPVYVKVYSLAKLKSVIDAMQGSDDSAIASVLADQFENEAGEKEFTPEFFLSDECPQCFIVELVQLFSEVNSGAYGAKKKMKERQSGPQFSG